MTVSIVPIIKAECAYRFDVTLRAIEGRGCYRRAVRPRWMAMWLARRLTDESLPTIGARFGRHHTTVLYAIRTIDYLLTVDAGLRETADALLATLTPLSTKKAPQHAAVAHG